MANINIRTSQEKKIVEVQQRKNNKVILSIYVLILKLLSKNTLSVAVNNKETNALCDTGATISCISWQYFDKAFPVNKPK